MYIIFSASVTFDMVMSYSIRARLICGIWSDSKVMSPMRHQYGNNFSSAVHAEFLSSKFRRTNIKVFYYRCGKKKAKKISFFFFIVLTINRILYKSAQTFRAFVVLLFYYIPLHAWVRLLSRCSKLYNVVNIVKIFLIISNSECADGEGGRVECHNKTPRMSDKT